MRIARWIRDGVTEEGFVIGDAVVPFPDGLTVTEVLGRGLREAHSLVERADRDGGTPLADVILLAPLVPRSIRDFVAFEEHVEGMTTGADGIPAVPPEWYEAPTFYFTNPHTVLGPADEVLPPVSDRLDFELEVAIVLGATPGIGDTNLTPGEAAARIFGYTIMNDWSARDLQAREMKVLLGPAKGKDFGTTLGPWIVTADELEQYLDEEGFLVIRAEARVNDELVGEDLISNAGWPFPELVAYASRNARVAAGDVLGSGTVGNGGCLGELWGRNGDLYPPPLRAGDVVHLIVEGIGDLVNAVAAPLPAPAIRAARKRDRRRGNPHPTANR